MEKLNGKIWVGFMINVVVALLGISDMAADGGTVAAVFITIIAGGLILTGVGIIMLAQGNPAGGILGAVGSAVFVPIGLICLIGCLQCRERLRNEGLDAAPVSEETRKCAEDSPIVPDAPATPDEGAATKEAPATMPAPASPAATAAAPEAPAAFESTPAPEQAPAATAETPLAAYGFVDERAWGWLFMLGSVVLFITALYHGTRIMPGCVACFIMGIVKIVQSWQRQQKQACILYRDRLECVTGLWTSDLVSIPYSGIREARCSGSKLRLTVASGDGTTTFNVYFSQMASDKRDEASAVLQDKMRELGVLREK